MIFSYDALGRPFAVKYSKNNGTKFTNYFYALNQQGDVVKIFRPITVKNADGNVTGYTEKTYATYTYDAWGKLIGITNSAGTSIINKQTTSTSLANLNPLRYRGYYYDNETGFYYLQSRYYDPVNRRFINADTYASTGQGFIGANMFAYCLNNPVNYSDYTGGEAVIISIIIGSFFETLLIIIGVTTVVLLILGGIHEISKAIKSAADDEPKEKPAVSPEGEAIAAPPETPQGGNNNNKNKKNSRKQNEKNYKKINGNKMARQLAQKFGFESAEALKEGYVGPASVSKFNMVIDMNSFEVLLIATYNSGIVVHTEIFLK